MSGKINHGLKQMDAKDAREKKKTIRPIDHLPELVI
jgi:hypothetical protein